ncbi:MAG TPA: sensor histidine kinase [Gemmatimonadaceae bacterium]|nr:sensor histidine kinase [Gemmatimonadaceae bacterium]
MQASVGTVAGEFSAALLQAAITLALAALCFGLWRRTLRPYFGWWALAFSLFLLRIIVIVMFLATADRMWLFWHQVATGWTALALLWAALVFAHAVAWRPCYYVIVAFPLLWSYVAVIRLDNFQLAAIPAVLFLSLATLWTGGVLLKYRRAETRGASTLLGWTFLLWGVHHLDYPVLRARGTWSPWGYYLDILFLLAVGAGILLLVNADLANRLHTRTVELEQLSRRMVRQHEDERRRLSLELHDETAQVFAAVKMQLEVVRERVLPADPPLAERLQRTVELVDEGMRGIRNVTNDLRPSLLDDLGLLPALRSLVADFAEHRGVRATLEAPNALPLLHDEAEVALFRALQEALANVARHAGGAPTHTTIVVNGGEVVMRITDQGPGFDGARALSRFEAEGHLGLTGMRERISALGGHVRVRSAHGEGVAIEIRVPLADGAVT